MKKKPFILAVETSGRAGSVAIAAGQQLLAELPFSGPMRHSSEVFPAIVNLLKRFHRNPKDIEHIYISVGPGSFTGLRIAAALAKTMHLANAAKIVAVDTLDVVAANATDYILKEKNADVAKIASILDAKRTQFFIAVYQRNTKYELRNTNRGIWEKTFPDSLLTVSQFIDKFAFADQPIWLLGEGLVYYEDKFKAYGIRIVDKCYWTARAKKVHLLGWRKALAGQFADPLTLTPCYLRAPDVKIKT
jgi:tRNA threonylcarbamoyladenosine biosynthesis protein TsaB